MTRHIIPALLAALLLVPIASPQKVTRNNRFIVFDDCASLSAAACDVTVQQPASGSKWVVFHYFEVYCSVACEVTVSRDGTAATATAATEVNFNGGVTPTVTAFIDSDAGAGTTLWTFQVAAGETVGRSLSGFFLEDDDSTANNLTVQTDAITGDAKVLIAGQEF